MASYYTVERSEEDKLAEQSEAILEDLRAMPAAAFTVHELMYVFSISSRLRWSTDVDYERRLLETLTDLRDQKKRPR